MNRVFVMIIRPAIQSDITVASSLWFERISLLQQSDNYFTPLEDASQVWEAKAGQWIDHDNFGFFVAERDSTLVGYVVVSIISGPVGLQPKLIGNIIDIGLDLHHAHSGLGKEMVQVVREWLIERDIHVLSVSVPSRYPVEEAFWRSIGAKPRFNEFWMLI